MKLIEYKCDTSRIHLNQGTLADTIKQALWFENEKLIDLIDFNNDYIFLEPSVLSYFLSQIEKSKKISLPQSLFGYIDSRKEIPHLKLKADLFGFANIPNLGYVKMNPFEERDLESNQIYSSVVKNNFVTQSSIRLCLHPTDQLALIKDITFDESPTESLERNNLALSDACRFMQNFASSFWELIKLVTREFVVFSSPNQNSFASISHHGTAYFNTENKNQTAVFFVDDISHQCGHVIFNALTLDTDRYLKVAKDYPLSEFIENKNDKRGVYSAFHGLFTYTCILYSLDKLIESNWDTILKNEAIGRLGFYMIKFGFDLSSIGSPTILTDEGMRLHKQFEESYNCILEKYEVQISKFDYSNQPYTFQYDLFRSANSI
jgi:hypothetical protein